MAQWPEKLLDFAYLGSLPQKLDGLAALAEPEDWEYKRTPSDHPRPILFNYLVYTYGRLAEEDKIASTPDGNSAVFNTGLVTINQEPIFALFDVNRNRGQQQWHLDGWYRRGQHQLGRFPKLPEMAHYFDDPASLVFYPSKDFRENIEHIVEDNRDRFPDPYRTMDSYTLRTFLRGAIDNARDRARRNYKTAIPQYYQGRVQLLLPLCLSSASQAEMALVVEDCGAFYRASTCLTLDMAYNNARQLARPDKDWLKP
jgi:hypothetical protein